MDKTKYPQGTRIRLLEPVEYLPAGTEGVVTCVDDIGTIHMCWENGSTLGLVESEDKFTVLPKEPKAPGKVDPYHVYVSSERLESIVIDALEWAIGVSEQVTFDLIGGMGISSDELDAIGFDKENFPNMHDATISPYEREE